MRLLVLVLILLAGCDLLGLESRPQMPSIVDVLVGTQGLAMNFVSFPSKMVMCQSGDISLEMRNVGASYLDGSYVFIVEDGVLSPEGQKQGLLKLEGKSQFNPQGTMERKSLKVQSKSLPSQLELYSTPVIVQVCYPYTTFLSAQVCVDAKSEGPKVCVPQSITFSSGQGAPVAVTKVEPRMIPEGNSVRPAFILTLANVGGGRIVSEKSVLSVCSGSKESLTSEIAVVAKLGGLPMECIPKSVPFEAGKEIQVMCQAPEVQIQDSFETILTAELKYGYVSTVAQEVVVTRLANQKDCK